MQDKQTFNIPMNFCDRNNGDLSVKEYTGI